MNFCLRHYEEPVADTCRACRQSFCSRCLVYAFGPKKPPYCVGCALAASGVRTSRPIVAGSHLEAAPPRPTRSERRAEKAARKQAAKEAKIAARSGAPAPAPAPAPFGGDAGYGDDRVPVPDGYLAPPAEHPPLGRSA